MDKVKLVITAEADRVNLAGILVKNGYTVRQGKRKITPTGKAVEYFLEISKEEKTE